MDSGYLASGDTLDDEYDVLRPPLPGEVIGIMDQLLCFEVRFDLILRALRAYLILILGPVDGMAYGPSTFTNFIYLVLSR